MNEKFNTLKEKCKAVDNIRNTEGRSDRYYEELGAVVKEIKELLRAYTSKQYKVLRKDKEIELRCDNVWCQQIMKYPFEYEVALDHMSFLEAFPEWKKILSRDLYRWDISRVDIIVKMFSVDISDPEDDDIEEEIRCPIFFTIRYADKEHPCVADNKEEFVA